MSKFLSKTWGGGAALPLPDAERYAPGPGGPGERQLLLLRDDSGNGVIVEPEAISYTAGQTVEEAIAASGHELERIEDGSIVAIDGVSAMYLRYYDGGGYDMTKPASEITAMFFCVNDVQTATR